MKLLPTAAAVILACALVSGCKLGGVGGGNSPPASIGPPAEFPVPPRPEPPPPELFGLSIDVSGLTGEGLVVEAGGETFTVGADGKMSLFDALEAGDAYEVRVVGQPVGPRQFCATTGGTGTIADANIEVAISCIAAVMMHGQVTDAPIPFATVTVKVGDTWYTTTADANGFFSILFASDNEDQIITTEAQGAEEQEHVVFTSILGTFKKLYAASDGGDLPEDDPDYNVTNVSTAKYALILQANNGELPDSDEKLQLAEKQVDATELFNLAAAIKLIVDNPSFSLPEGVGSVLEFATNKAAVTAFIEEVTKDDPDDNPLQQALTEILADTSLVPGFRASTLQPMYYQVAASAPGIMARQGGKFELDADGTGVYLSGFAGVALNRAITWEIDDGILRLTYDDPEPDIFNTSLTFAGATQEQIDFLAGHDIFGVLRRMYPVEEEFQLLGTGSLVLPVRHTTMLRHEFEPITVGGETIEFDDIVNVGSMFTELWNPAGLPDLPFTTDFVVGDWAMYIYRDVGPLYNFSGDFQQQFVAEVFTFHADGTAVGHDSADTMTWSISNGGRLVLEYGDGWVQEVRILERDGLVVAADFDARHAASDTRFAYHHVIAKRDPALQLADSIENTAGEYWSSYVNQWRAMFWDGDELTEAGWNLGLFGFEFAPGGAVVIHSISIPFGSDVKSHMATPVGAWEVDADGHSFINYSTMVRYRRWQPLAVDSHGHMHVVEEDILQAFDGSGEMWIFIAPRTNIYRKEPLPDLD